MINLFDNKILDLTNITCHSGGAIGADSLFDEIGQEFGVKTKAYSYKTKSHTSPNKVEISEEDYKEGIVEINRANKVLNRYGIQKYMNLLARNWAQVKYSKETFAIGTIVKVGEKDSKGYYNKSGIDIVSGGTGYAVQMSINHNHPLYVFDQNRNKWFRWSYTSLSFIPMGEIHSISEQDFTGIGTIELNSNGEKAIRDLYEKTFKK